MNAIVQDKKETLREYMERFIRAGVEVPGAYERLKFFIFESKLRDDCKFKEELEIREAKDMNDLLTRAQLYINYKKKKLAEEEIRSKQSNKASNDRRCSDDEKTKGSRHHPRDYTLLKASRETILRDATPQNSRRRASRHHNL